MNVGRTWRLAALAPVAAMLAGCAGRLSVEEIARYDGFGGSITPPPEYKQAEAAAAAGRAADALALLRPMRDRFPENVRVHRLYQDMRIALGETAAVTAEYEQFRSEHPGPLADTLLSRLQSDAAQGAALSQRAVERNDRFVWGWYARGWWDLKREHIDEARAAFERVLELQPDFVPVRRPYAILLRRGDKAAALESIEYALGKSQARPDDRLFLAALRLSLGGAQVERAEREFREVLREMPESADAAKGLAAALLEEAPNDPAKWREAKAIYERLAKEYPGDATIDFNLGVVAEIFENDGESALYWYRRFLERATDASIFQRVRAQWWVQDLEAGRHAETRPTSQPASKPAGDGR